MKTKITYTFTIDEAIAELKKQYPEAFNVEIIPNSGFISERKFINIRNGFDDKRINYIAIDPNGKAWRVFLNGSRDNFDSLTLSKALEFVKQGFWKELT